MICRRKRAARGFACDGRRIATAPLPARLQAAFRQHHQESCALSSHYHVQLTLLQLIHPHPCLLTALEKALLVKSHSPSRSAQGVLVDKLVPGREESWNGTEAITPLLKRLPSLLSSLFRPCLASGHNPTPAIRSPCACRLRIDAHRCAFGSASTTDELCRWALDRPT